MGEKNENALVPKPPNAIEKSVLGVKRILDGIVADSLVLAKKEQLRIIPFVNRCDLLVIDDEPPFVEFVGAVIRRRYPNLSVQSAKDGIEGLKKAKAFKPRIVLTGVKMPRMDGLQMIELIRQDPALQNTRIIVCTGSYTEGVKKRALELGVDKLFPKPFKVEEALSAIADLLRIGEYEYEWCEPDYQQILIWAEKAGLKPEDLLAQLLDPASIRENESGQPDLTNFFKEPIFADGKLLKVNMESCLLRRGRLAWTDGLDITHFRIIGRPGETDLNDLGLLPLPQLVALSCRWLGLTHLDLTTLPLLEYLNCSNNRLAKLQLSSIPQLAQLLCSWNELIELNFEQTPNLRQLLCWANRLTQLDLSGLNWLRTVSCGKNSLRELKLSDLPILSTLFCPLNHLLDLNLTETPELKLLHCFDNEISELDLSLCRKLLRLECSQNRLTSLDLSSAQELRYLNCANNAISELDLGSCPNLVEVDCSGNPISVLDIRGLKRLRVLNPGHHTKEVLMDSEQATVLLRQTKLRDKRNEQN